MFWNKGMKIVLINPIDSSTSPIFYIDMKCTTMPAINLSLIAALTPKEHEINIIDEMVEKADYDNLDADLVGISVITPTAPRAYEIADILTARGTPVVMGGIHASLMPNEALKHVTSVVIGEAEEVWLKVVSDFKRGRLKRIYRAKKRTDLSKLPYPRRDLLKGNYGHLYKPVQATRGCPYRCDFCSVHKFFGGTYRTRPVKDVINELKGMKNGFLNFVDDNIVGNRKYAKELFKALIPLKLNWISQASLSVAKDDELLKLAAESGCDCLAIGFESVSQNSLYEAKKVNRSYEYPKLIKKIQDYGIEIWGCFVFGFDFDKKDIFQKTIDFCNGNDIRIGQFTILTPFPGTALFNRLEKQKRILTYDWKYYDCAHCVFKPKNMSALELEDGLIQFYKDFYSLKSVIRKIIKKATIKGILKDERSWKSLVWRFNLILGLPSLIERFDKVNNSVSAMDENCSCLCRAGSP
jgi:radical SAM superfamily enzyme YgiQ (UPF0313 family)